MKKYLARIQSQSDQHKQQYAKILALIGTAIVVVLWLTFAPIFPKENGKSQPDNSFVNDLDAVFEEGAEEFNVLEDESVNHTSINQDVQDVFISEDESSEDVNL
ncbi:hypothetical protein KC901_00445 [Patescibacteria group bacterium]|nr:hypothetical protein [Patescibacteria group bacterium]